jgi:hypothetical protein
MVRGVLWKTLTVVYSSVNSAATSMKCLKNTLRIGAAKRFARYLTMSSLAAQRNRERLDIRLMTSNHTGLQTPQLLDHDSVSLARALLEVVLRRYPS